MKGYTHDATYGKGPRHHTFSLTLEQVLQSFAFRIPTRTYIPCTGSFVSFTRQFATFLNFNISYHFYVLSSCPQLPPGFHSLAPCLHSKERIPPHRSPQSYLPRMSRHPPTRRRMTPFVRLYSQPPARTLHFSSNHRVANPITRHALTSCKREGGATIPIFLS